MSTWLTVAFRRTVEGMWLLFLRVMAWRCRAVDIYGKGVRWCHSLYGFLSNDIWFSIFRYLAIVRPFQARPLIGECVFPTLCHSLLFYLPSKWETFLVNNLHHFNFYVHFSGITGTKTSIVVVFISSVLFNIPRFFQWYSDSIPCAAGSKLYFRSPGALQSSDNVARKQVWVRLSVCLSLWKQVHVRLSVSLKTGASSSVCLLCLSVCRSVSVMWQLPMMLLVGQTLCGAPPALT